MHATVVPRKLLAASKRLWNPTKEVDTVRYETTGIRHLFVEIVGASSARA